MNTKLGHIKAIAVLGIDENGFAHRFILNDGTGTAIMDLIEQIEGIAKVEEKAIRKMDFENQTINNESSEDSKLNNNNVWLN
jgi:hypothetical protein